MKLLISASSVLPIRRAHSYMMGAVAAVGAIFNTKVNLLTAPNVVKCNNPKIAPADARKLIRKAVGQFGFTHIDHSRPDRNVFSVELQMGEIIFHVSAMTRDGIIEEGKISILLG